MDLICGLVGKFCDLVIDLTWEQLCYLIYYHRNIDQLNRQLKELTLKRISLQHRIDEAKNNVEQIEGEVLHWLGEVDELSKQVQKFHEEESQAKIKCNIISCPNPWLCYKLSKRAKAMTEEVVKISARRNFDRISYPIPLPPMVEVTNREGNERVDSRVPIMNQILEELKNPGVNMIGLCGLGGVGKTTIAKEVAKNQKIFEKVIMATVSQELNIEKIQGEIAEKLSMQLTENNNDVRAFRLFERLKQEKNMLLILDDLWEELDLGKVGIPFVSVENEGCKILLTSRNKTLLLDIMKCQKIVEVGALLEDEALELFKKIAKLSTESSSPELTSIATDIVRKCGGLPLAIATAAKALSSKDINEWQDALARLNNPFRRNITLTRDVDTILKWSYDRLRSSENKQIFLLASMLSHDPSVEDLLMYSVGLDILHGIKNMEDARVGVFVIVSKLKSLNLFLDSIDSHHFTIHDVFRDIALSIATSEESNAVIERYRRLNEWPDDPEGCKGICLQECDICDLPEELNGPILEFFLLHSKKTDLTIPNVFFKSSKNLKVLAITKVNFSSLPSLSFLQRLKALCLHSCLLEDITEIRSLRKLKILSLAYSEIQQLPVEMAELTSLQMLNLSHCYKLKVIPQKLLSSLKNLEVLHMEGSFNQWKVEGSSKADENTGLDELMDLPISSLEIHIPNLSMLPETLFLKMNLRRYRIFIGERWRWWQSNYGASKILKLELESSIDLTAGLRNLSKGVEDLHLYGSNGQENVLYNLDASGFPCLRHLRIESNDDIKCIVLNSAHHEDAFRILESLELKNLKALENLCEGPNDIVFCQLHTLKMENLPALSGDISIKDRTTKNASHKIFKSLFNKVLLPKLEILKLSNLNSLMSLIWDDQFLHNSFNNLKTLRVEKCGFVKLVPLHVLKSLNNLEEVVVKSCDMLEIVFDFEDFNDYYKEMDSSSVVVPLKELTLENLPKLKNVWSNNWQGNVSFPSLRSVYVNDCVSLTSIFPASIAKGMLCDLEELKIYQCGVDVIVAEGQVSESVPVTFRFSNLTSLVLFGLPNLRNFYPQKHTVEWSQLSQLSIQCCDELEIFDKKEVSSLSEIYEEENMLDSKYPLLPHDKVIRNLERLTLQGKQVEKIGSGQFLMYYFPKLKQLHLSLEKKPCDSYWQRSPNLGELKLSGNFEKFIENNNVAALCFPKLTLNNISNMRSLSPSLVSSPNLTHLIVKFCREWTTLITSSIARSLVHLTHLSVSSCCQIEEIITKQEGEDDEDREIFFNKMKFLEFVHLERLRRFCCHNYTFRFPLLEHVTIRECPRLTIFCPGAIHAPQLQSVQVDEYKPPTQIWMTDLNNTIQHLFTFKVVLSNTRSMMINAKNITRIVDVFLNVSRLYVESFTDEGVTFPYRSLEKFPNLDWLEVEHCSFEEIFPSQDQIIDFIGKISPLYTLVISYMDKLKSIWKDDSQLPPIHQNLTSLSIKSCCSLVKLAPSSASFQGLYALNVSKCHQLIHLVTTSTAKSLVSLESLEINDCKSMEEIVRNDTNEDVQAGITFNQLRKIKLIDMPSLKMFSPQSHTFEFPKLEEIEISGCPQMKKFCPGVLKTPNLSKVIIEEHGMELKDEEDLNKTMEGLRSAKDSINI
ncbi:hypothetical protein QN277_005889 [Acacia crassicarpa]|uniref:AAA+ ATPase domain-containing protein n=1 Tax=Acacia crassicarpa TaxID=499986 RepID=A0AAE1IX74_9FABA|nr:hypothetical protein QN277_005889 [Acacia crassicarpa]